MSVSKIDMIVNEIFYSLQGEGFYSGTPSIFIRFSGCNLQCPFCDTQHQQGRTMSEEEIIEEVDHYKGLHVVITGGEPSLQLTASLVDKLHAIGKYVAVETNGTHELPGNVDWITLSPKESFVKQSSARVKLTHCNELKVVFTGAPIADYSHIKAQHHFLQPCDTGNKQKNASILKATIDYCLDNPQWSLSLQMHKIVGVR